MFFGKLTVLNKAASPKKSLGNYGKVFVTRCDNKEYVVRSLFSRRQPRFHGAVMATLKESIARSTDGSFVPTERTRVENTALTSLLPLLDKSRLKDKNKVDTYIHTLAKLMKDMEGLRRGLDVLQRSAVDDHRATKALIEETPIRGLDQVKDKLRRRGVEAVLSGTEWLKAKEVGERAAPLAENKHSQVSRWQKAGKIFAIERAGVKYYPNYIFDALGNPIPEVAEVLKSFEGYTPIRVASWFESTSSAAGGKRPRELLSNEPKSVIELARKHVEGALHG